jgi:hypothetical protein
MESASDRLALVLLGDISVAIDAVCALERGDDLIVLDGGERIEALRGSARLRDLFRYALSDAHLSLRTELGADGRRD